MRNSLFSRYNFHSHTFCVWQEVPSDTINGMRINFTSKSKSQYIFVLDGLYRISDHWGRVANCHWRINPISAYKNQNRTVAFAFWTDFYSNEDHSNLFYIKVDWELSAVNFYHKSDKNIIGTEIFRNAKETAKIIRIIKEILSSEGWAKYLNHKNLKDLRRKIVTELITTSRSFIEIKKDYLV